MKAKTFLFYYSPLYYLTLFFFFFLWQDIDDDDGLGLLAFRFWLLQRLEEKLRPRQHNDMESSISPNGFHLMRGRETSQSDAKRNPTFSRDNSPWQKQQQLEDDIWNWKCFFNFSLLYFSSQSSMTKTVWDIDWRQGSDSYCDWEATLDGKARTFPYSRICYRKSDPCYGTNFTYAMAQRLYAE